MPFEYAPAAESPSIVDIRSPYGLFIDGGFRDAAGDAATGDGPGGGDGAPGERLSTVNPATGQALADVAVAGPADVDAAVRAARRAFEGHWGGAPGRDRARYLYRIAGAIQQHARELAVLQSLDSGTPVREYRTVDLPLAAAHVFYHAGWADKLRYAVTTPPPVASAAPAGRPGVAWPGPRPVGVVAALVGWDCPLLGLAWAVAPALACGDTVVLRPAATSPLTALRFAEICRQVDLPAGVVNVVTGDEPTARRLVEHPGVDLVTCGGPRDLGRSVARWVAGAGKRLSLDLGGTAANLVFDDAPVDETVEGIVNAVFFNRGHVGHTGTRLLVQESIAEDLLAALRERMARLRVGDPLDGNTDVGAVHTPVHLAKLRDLVEAAAADGGQRWSAPAELPQQGFWFAPTILTGVSQANLMAREEVYGPVLSVRTFRTADEAVALANNIPSGPATGIWTAKTSRMLAVAERLHSGVVWANTFNRLDPTAPYGGYQESGYGRAGGRHGLEAYLA